MRASGILMHITSLPSPHGIGTLGKQAWDFVDFLAKGRPEVLADPSPGPNGVWGLPISDRLGLCGNPYLIDLDLLEEDGLLTREEIDAPFWGDDPQQVDFGAIYAARRDLLYRAYQRGWERDREAVTAFGSRCAGWLPDYALFTALKRHFGMRSWTEWPDEDVRLRRSAETLARYGELLRTRCSFAFTGSTCFSASGTRCGNTPGRRGSP